MTKSCKCVWRCTVCCCYGEQRYIFPHYPSACLWFIYIHGYPDNEAFNPGDPAVRTMNPITSCRLWAGMVVSDRWERLQSASNPIIFIPLMPVFPVHGFCSNLSTGWGNLGSLRCGPTVLQRLICMIPEDQFRPTIFTRPLTTYRNTPEVSLFPHMWS